MLGRKQSMAGDHSIATEVYATEDVVTEAGPGKKKWIRRCFQGLSLLSLVSVSLNTPQTFLNYPVLRIATYVADWICFIGFFVEIIYKVRMRGLWYSEGAYLRNRWGQFDTVMISLIIISLVFQTLEVMGILHPIFSILRAPRPLIIIRFIRTTLSSYTLSMPKSRITQIFKRSSHQIYNVTLFFIFFMVFYGLLGVQFFGDLQYHCVRNCIQNAQEVTVNDLTIPDTYCRPNTSKSSSGYKCPPGFHCMNLASRSRFETGFTGFGQFFFSCFTVYQAASQEGWVYIMYRASDTFQPWKSLVYFMTMIFFLAWMVRNVFIAVITETFNEIRVQFQQVWGNRDNVREGRATQILEGDKKRWNLVTVNEFRLNGWAPGFCQSMLRSPVYHILNTVITVANAIVTASISFRHPIEDKPREHFFQLHRKIEIGFVIFYNCDVMFKIFCLGFKCYMSRSIHKFEFLLAMMTTIHVFPSCFLTPISIFQVLRIVNIRKNFPVLEAFVFKIFGPGKKLTILISFTICLLLIMSCISMQLFCTLRDDNGKYYDNYSTFPYAFMSMFQILTQEAWPEVMSKTMRLAPHAIYPLVALFFIIYHLFMTLIVMSLFVAVILDNLELDEDAKKIKQLKLQEDSSDIKEDLPLRLRLFEKFPQRPLMCRINRTPSEYSTPKVRESFVTRFVYEEHIMDNLDSEKLQPSLNDPDVRYRKNATGNLLSAPSPKLQNVTFIKKSAVSKIINSVRRSIRGGSQIFGKRTGTVRIHENIKENGHIQGAGISSVSPSSTAACRPQNLQIRMIQAKFQQAEMRRNRKEDDLRENHPCFDRPLFAVPRESSFRKICRNIVSATYDPQLKNPQTGKDRIVRFRMLHKMLGLVPYLDWFMIIVTTLTTISQLFETSGHRVMDNPYLQIADYAFVITMAFELIVKVLAEGLIFTPKALLKDVSGILDLFIFTANLVWLCWMPSSIKPGSFSQIVMIIRCFRTLRIFILVPHMRKVVSELCKSFKEIFLVAVLLFLVLFIFASYGVHLFGKKFAACNDKTIKHRDNCTGIYKAHIFVTHMNLPTRKGEEPPWMMVPRVWKNPRRFHFDNIGSAMLALFEVLSYKGWIDLRDVIVEKMGPSYALYIQMYVFIGSMIGLTLFVGVVIANYRENKGTALLTVDQMRWSDLKKRLKIAQPLHVPPKPESNVLQAFIYDVTQNIYFKRFIAFLVLLNSSLLAVNWEQELENHGYLTKAATIITTIFFIEVSMKLVAFTPSGYWHSWRNRFDLLVTVLGLMWIFFHNTTVLYESFEVYIIIFGYVIIIFRFLTITGKHATLSMLMQTVVVSVYKSFFIIMLMFILITCYALTGVILFGNLKHGEAINRQANFQTAGGGIVMLFRIVTGEDWNRILHDCMQKPPACTKRSWHNFWETNCGTSTGALLFFCSFYIIITYIVLNLLVAIIMENFSLFYSNEEDALLSYADIRNFQSTWNIVDVGQRGMIPVRRVKFILRLLKGRLEVDTQKDRLLFKHMCYELERLHNGEDVTFHDVLSMLSYRSIDIRKALQLEELLAREELEYIIEEEVAKLTIRKWLDGCLKRIREKEQTLLAGLRAMNEPVLIGLRPVTEDKEDIMEEDSETETQYDENEHSIQQDKYQQARQVVTRTDSLSSCSGKRYLTPCGTNPLEADWARRRGRSEDDGGSTPRGEYSPAWRYGGSMEEVKSWWHQQLGMHDEEDEEVDRWESWERKKYEKIF